MSTPIALAKVVSASKQVIPRLDQNFFRVRFDRLTPGEKTFLRTMAERGSEPQNIGELAELMGKKVQGLGPVRAKLIKKGMIYSPAHGEVAFTVPHFDDFMIRTIPIAPS